MISIENKNYVCSFVACLCAVIEEGLNTSVICGIETDTLFERINGEPISNHSTPKQHAFSLKYLPVAIKNGKLGSPVILSLLDSFEISGALSNGTAGMSRRNQNSCEGTQMRKSLAQGALRKDLKLLSE